LPIIPRLREAAKKAIDTYGIGPGAVRTIAGTMSLHNQLESRLAAFKGVEAVYRSRAALRPTWRRFPRWWDAAMLSFPTG
jgi:hypothetical protein